MKSELKLNQAGYVAGNARVLAGVSELAYGPAWTAQSGMTLANRVVTILDPGTDTRVDIYEFDDCWLVAFQGTRDWRQWLADADCWLVPFEGLGVLPARGNGGWGPVKVHRGFLRDVTSIWDRAIQVLRGTPGEGTRPTGSRDKPIVVGGHSKGGAEAVIFAARLKLAGYPVHSVYTFGQPRVGNAAWRAVYEGLLGAQTYRLVDVNDIVARLPLPVFGFRHHKNLNLITISGEVVMNPSLAWLIVNDALGLWSAWRTGGQVLAARVPWLAWLVDIERVLGKVATDHFVAKYVQALTTEAHESRESNE